MRFLSGVVFKRILVIFIVGLVSRGVINTVFDTNVFKDYTTCISLMYYVFMACFSGFIHELPSISFNVLNFKVVKDAIRMFCDSNLLGKNKISLGGDMFSDNNNLSSSKDLSKTSLVCKQDESERITEMYNGKKRFKSAGMRGLYGDPTDRSIVYRDISDGDKGIRYTLRNKLKSRVLWCFWKQFSHEHVSYRDYYESFDKTQKISMKEEIKRSISKK